MIPIHVLLLLIYAFGYMIFALAYAGVTGIFVYPFLDWTKTIAAAYYIAIPIFLILIYFLLFAIDYAKRRLLHYRIHTDEVDDERNDVELPKREDEQRR